DRGDAHPGPLRVAGIDENGVEAEAAIAGKPAGTSRVAGERGELRPRLAAIPAHEEARLLHAGIERVRLRGVARHDLPDPLQLEPALLRVGRAARDLRPA